MPILFCNTPKLPADGKEAEFRGLADSGANNSFISTKRAKELGLEIEESTATVKNGDGSKQVSPGQVTVTFSIGARFKTTHRFRVINLEIFDVIFGLDFFKQYQLKFEYEPFRLSAICPGTRTRAARRVPLPTCLFSRVDEDGRDCSTYVCDREELVHTCNELGRREGRVCTIEDALVLVEDDDAFSYQLMLREITSFAQQSTHAEFVEYANALLSDLRGVQHDNDASISELQSGKRDHNDNRGDAANATDAAPEAKIFNAPSAGIYSDQERLFREQIVKDFPDLCSDSLPLDGPSATLPDGTPYSVKLKLKPGMEPQGRRQFRIPEAYREELQSTIQDLLKYKLVEPCESPYSNPIFLVPKPRRPDGSSAGMRLVWDGRGVNRAIESDSFLIPRVEDLIDRVARCKYEAERAGFTHMIFSGLDQRTSFWQLALDDESRPLTAFGTSAGQFQWRCLPMGMLTSSAHLQRFTEALLRPFTRSNKFQY